MRVQFDCHVGTVKQSAILRRINMQDLYRCECARELLSSDILMLSENHGTKALPGCIELRRLTWVECNNPTFPPGSVAARLNLDVWLQILNLLSWQTHDLKNVSLTCRAFYLSQ